MGKPQKDAWEPAEIQGETAVEKTDSDFATIHRVGYNLPYWRMVIPLMGWNGLISWPLQGMWGEITRLWGTLVSQTYTSLVEM